MCLWIGGHTQIILYMMKGINNVLPMPDEEVQELMDGHDLDEDVAERAHEIMSELGVDEDDAVEIAENE